MVGLLVVIVIMGGTAVAVFALQNTAGGGKYGSIGSGSPPSLIPSPSRAAANVAQAAQATCRADYQAVEDAASYYESVNGKPASSMTELRTLLKDPVSNPNFVISVDPRHPGQIEVASPGHPAASGEGNCAYAG